VTRERFIRIPGSAQGVIKIILFEGLHQSGVVMPTQAGIHRHGSDRSYGSVYGLPPAREWRRV